MKRAEKSREREPTAEQQKGASCPSMRSTISAKATVPSVAAMRPTAASKAVPPPTSVRSTTPRARPSSAYVQPPNLDAATQKVSAFLSDSRLMAEKISTLCAHSGCAFLCTGLSGKYCCRMCARSPGAHGPRCQKKMLPCLTPGCGFAVTGLAPAHCCAN